MNQIHSISYGLSYYGRTWGIKPSSILAGRRRPFTVANTTTLFFYSEFSNHTAWLTLSRDCYCSRHPKMCDQRIRVNYRDGGRLMKALLFCKRSDAVVKLQRYEHAEYPRRMPSR